MRERIHGNPKLGSRLKAMAAVVGVVAFVGLSAVSAHADDGEVRDAENTGLNERDRKGGHPTAFDQGTSKADRELTAAIRRAVVADDSLSTNAHNVKIITADGVVTLRGPVDSMAEKNAVEAKAKSVAGVARVDSQLEVDRD